MRAVRIDHTGGLDVLTLREMPEPTPGPGEILVDLESAGVNYIDVYHRTGLYARDLPFVMGIEGAGTVRRVGLGVTDLTVGQGVAWKSASGSYAEQVVVPAAEALAVPPELQLQTAAAVTLQGLTAHFLATSVYPISEDDTVLVHAAAGGVGLLLTQIARLRGATVLGTASSAEKAAAARQAGASAVFGYDDFGRRVREFTNGEGVSVVYDGVGRATFDQGLLALRVKGMMVLFGATSGLVPPLDLQRLNANGSLYVTRPTLMDYTRTRAELVDRAQELFGWVADGALQVRIGARYELADVQQAHQDLEGRRTLGKLLLAV